MKHYQSISLLIIYGMIWISCPKGQESTSSLQAAFGTFIDLEMAAIRTFRT